MLDEQRRAKPEIERFFTNEVEEPVFVKNLENVQGDERDTIIFSVGYGPDDTGRPSMNFGPLNKEGGERRLNVAVTRAKRRLIVFSSMTSDMIDLRRTRVTGVRHFKQFLDYAERGPESLDEFKWADAETKIETRFEHALREKLIERGYEVDERIGAGYRIDLAIRDKKDPGRYLLGIECDGLQYRSANTARDRDRTRPSVLRGLGWNLHRVWSSQWYINPDRCLAEIDAAVVAIQEKRSSIESAKVDAVSASIVASARSRNKARDRAPRQNLQLHTPPPNPDVRASANATSTPPSATNSSCAGSVQSSRPKPPSFKTWRCDASRASASWPLFVIASGSDSTLCSGT